MRPASIKDLSNKPILYALPGTADGYATSDHMYLAYEQGVFDSALIGNTRPLL